MTARPVPRRHWRSYGNDPLPSPAEALGEPFSAFPSWFLRIECDRCGKVQMVNESARQMARPDAARHPRPDAPRRLRRAGGKAELLTGVDGASSRPVRRIVLRTE